MSDERGVRGGPALSSSAAVRVPDAQAFPAAADHDGSLRSRRATSRAGAPEAPLRSAPSGRGSFWTAGWLPPLGVHVPRHWAICPIRTRARPPSPGRRPAAFTTRFFCHRRPGRSAPAPPQQHGDRADAVSDGLGDTFAEDRFGAEGPFFHTPATRGAVPGLAMTAIGVRPLKGVANMWAAGHGEDVRLVDSPRRHLGLVGAAAAFAGKVDLGGQAAPGPSESLVGAVVPGRRPYSGTVAWSCGPGRVLVGPAGHRVDADHQPVDPPARSASAWSACRIRPQVPSADQRRCRS